MAERARICRNCRFWGPPNDNIRNDNTPYAYDCKRHAPIAYKAEQWPGRYYPMDDIITRYPITSGQDWCGDFEPYIKERL